MLQVPSKWINQHISVEYLNFVCNSCDDNNKHQINHIRKFLAQMMWGYNNQSTVYQLKLQSLLFELLHVLFVNFQVQKSAELLNESQKYILRMSNIIHYLHENYNKEITLQSLSKKEYLSSSHISRFFKKQAGTSFKGYLTRISLEHAVKHLLFTDKSILQISLDNGFPNPKSFLDIFKETYNETPSTYRKNAKANYQTYYSPKSQSSNYFEMRNYHMFANLYKKPGYGILIQKTVVQVLYLLIMEKCI